MDSPAPPAPGPFGSSARVQPQPEGLGWYSRGYLPHCDMPDIYQSITFRLHDAVPESVIERWKEELGLEKSLGAPAPLPARSTKKCAGKGASAPSGASATGNRESEVELRKRIARYEDAGHGECWLRDARMALLVEATLLKFDGERYRLIAWCVMPNHVHSLIETRPNWPLAGVLHSWKSYTAQEANKLLCRRGPFWFREYYDRFIRDAAHYDSAVRYIEQNPVRARLAAAAEEWRFGSARRREPGSAGTPAGGS